MFPLTASQPSPTLPGSMPIPPSSQSPTPLELLLMKLLQGLMQSGQLPPQPGATGPPAPTATQKQPIGIEELLALLGQRGGAGAAPSGGSPLPPMPPARMNPIARPPILPMQPSTPSPIATPYPGVPSG